MTLTQHYAELQAFTAADWKGLRAWMAWEHPELELTAQRLKDTWLSQRCADSVTPVVVLMAENGVGRHRLARLAVGGGISRGCPNLNAETAWSG